MSLEEAVGSGDLRRALEALRDELAREIEGGSTCVKCGGALSSSTAALAKQLRDTLKELAGIAVPEGSKTDDLKRKRAERQAGVAKRASRGDEHGAGGS
jgi:hypothetical protein